MKAHQEIADRTVFFGIDLVKLRTSLIVSLQNILCRNNGYMLKTAHVKELREDREAPSLTRNEDLAMVGMVSKEAIDLLTRQIMEIEAIIEGKMEFKPSYAKLQSHLGAG
jgi:hypothetical protein